MDLPGKAAYRQYTATACRLCLPLGLTRRSKGRLSLANDNLWGVSNPVSIERFIVCTCGHCIDQHTGDGCGFRKGRKACTCRFTHDNVLEVLLDAERESIHQQWRRAEAGRW